MTGSIAFDLVIGLVFIYLLYSLLASIIQEIISTLLGLRARTLSRAIGRMLKEDSKKTKTKFSAAFLEFTQRFSRNFRGENDELHKKFYNHSGIRSMTSGQYYSKPSYINSKEFSTVLIDILFNEEDSEKSVSNWIKEILPKKSGRIPEAAADNLKVTNEDIENYKKYLEEWFDHTMERVSGWYKRSIQTILLITGFFIAVIFNVDTIEIVGLLSTDKDAREAMVELAANYIEENQELITYYKGSEQDSSSIKDLSIEDFETKLDNLLNIKNKLQNDIDVANNILGFRPKDELPVFELTQLDELDDNQRFLDTLNGKIYALTVSKTLLAKNTYKYYNLDVREVADSELVYADFNYWKFISENFCDNFWGYLLTALAISLGAPFWFDLLSKFIRIRTSIKNNTNK